MTVEVVQLNRRGFFILAFLNSPDKYIHSDLSYRLWTQILLFSGNRVHKVGRPNRNPGDSCQGHRLVPRPQPHYPNPNMLVASCRTPHPQCSGCPSSLHLCRETSGRGLLAAITGLPALSCSGGCSSGVRLCRELSGGFNDLLDQRRVSPSGWTVGRT